MKRLIQFATGIFLLLALAGCARGKQADSWTRISRDKRVVVGLDDSFVPMGFRKQNGQLTGFDVDLARTVFKRVGVEVDFQPIEWSMKETELKNETIDLIWNGYSINQKRAKQVAFSKPYLKNQQVLIVKKKSGIKNLAGMKDQTLGVQSSSSGASALAQDKTVLRPLIAKREPVLYDTFNDAFLDLNAGRIQGVLIDSVYGEYTIAHQKDAGAYRVLSVPYASEDFAVGLRKSDSTLEKKVNAGLQAVKRDGTMKRLVDKWFGESK